MRMTEGRSSKMENLITQVFLIAAAICVVTCTADYLEQKFSDASNNGLFNNMVVDKNTGKIYIGAVNRLYQLSEFLTQEERVNTGPQDDNPNCPPTGECTCASNCEDYIRKPTNSINKALVIDYNHARLIACSNLFQGHCEKRHLDDISEVDNPIYTALVSNDQTSPVVMFIALGPQAPESPLQPQENVLYIGVTRSTEGLNIYKDLVPAVSSRNLDSFELAYHNVVAQTKKELEQQQRDTFRMYYVNGFSSGGFSYFLTVQKQSVDVGSTNYVTRLSRVCQNDPFYYSYTEVPLECENTGATYNILRAIYVARPGGDLARSLGLADVPPLSELDDVLFALFSKSQPQSNEPIADSVLCVFPLQQIRRVFTKTIQDCFQGVGNTGPAHIVSPHACISTTFPINDDYCGDYDFNNPIAGDTPVTAEAVIRFEDTSTTAIAVTVTHEYTVAFVGTDKGTLKKVVIESSSSALEYENVVIEENSPINADIAFDRSKTHIYAMTGKKIDPNTELTGFTRVTRVKVQECSQYTSCAECLEATDPFCGWCVLENKCSMRQECVNADSGHRWLPYRGAQCTRITSVMPNQVQIIPNIISVLTLTVQNLPSLTEGDYQCAFTGSGITRTTTAQVGEMSGDTTLIQCETPFPNLLPPIPTGHDHIIMKLSVRMNEQDFVSENFTFFDCSRHSACTDCTESAFPCTWCVERHVCTNNRESCLADILITGQNVPGSSDRPGPDNCPRIQAMGFSEILVPSGTEKQVEVEALNLQTFQNNFRCFFNIDGGKEVPASRTPGTDFIQCEPVYFQYSGDSQHINVPFHITWGDGDNALDNPDLAQVKVYKCSQMANNCGACLIVESKYNCGWCGMACTIQHHCPPGNTWLDHSQDCPNPVITGFYPQTGPRLGGTSLTIEGENLGKIFDDIKDGVTVADINCIPIASEYIPAKQIVCRTGESDIVKSGGVKVMVANRYDADSRTRYSYVEPSITDFHPKIGPISGGTKLTINGQHMNTGTNISATVVGLPCTMISMSPSSAVCITSASRISNSGEVKMFFDEAHVTSGDMDFGYVEDPTIVDVQPERGIISGGLLVTAIGSNLDSIVDPRMYIVYHNNEYFGNCSVKSAMKMVCYSPSIAAGYYARTPEPPESVITVPYGFIMDNVTHLRNYTAHMYGQRVFSFYADPVLEPFEEEYKYYQPKNEYLTINGHYLNLVLTKDDVLVMIGSAPCNVTSIAEEQLTCRPPLANTEGVGNNPSVTVHIGNLTFFIGELKYEGPLGMSMPLLIGIAAGGGILLLIIVTIIILYRNKSRENDQRMKHMQNQMDILESKVAKECKEAFAELQTDMTEITSDISGQNGIPFRDYRSFCMRVLFPNVPEDEHPVTRYFEVEYSRRDGVTRGLKLFSQLLHNKTFLLLFIRTLEEHKEFSMRERVNVASLISVTLQNRMEYHTDILKTLLGDLIEKTIDGKGHPKLLLRRTESIAEKMLTNWFTFLLYKFLKECAGEPLYMLYRAVRQQIDKGPVDFFMSEAKYSLSEDKLIRQQCDYKPMTIYVLDPDIQYGPQEHPVKVLDCDAISQVKEKILDAIYKNAPFSSRPDKDDLDLEYQTGVKGRLVLQDEDMTTKNEGEYKRINTLAHYRVPDGAVMALVPKQSSMYNLSLGSDRSGSHHRFDLYGTSGSPSLSRSLSPHGINFHEMENGGQKYYHLIKATDSELHKDGDRGNKMVSEIYLTRLLATKVTLQQFVDDLFETIFSTANRGCALPLAIKYMFDFLDDQALHYGISDPEVVHTWKSNSLPLRFWVNVVKNPDFVFDGHKSNIVDSCLSVVAQTFMDSCSMSEHRLGKDSPSSKLLYARDIPKYKKWVERYYLDIKQMPAISDQDMNAMLADESRQHQNDFNLNAALYELYQYVARYNNQLMMMLEEDEFARNYRLSTRLEQVHQFMESIV